MFHYLLALCAFSLVVQAQQVTQVQSIDRFDRVTRDAALAVVYLYDLAPGTQEGDRFTTVDDNHTILRSLSRNYRYRRAGVKFISANLQRDDLKRLTARYNLSGTDTLLLVRKGKAYTNDRLTGSFKRDKVRRFIDDHFGDFIDDMLAEQADRQQRYQEEYRSRRPVKKTYVTYAPYFGPYYGYPGYAYPYYPYGGYGFGYYRPGFGISFGF